MSSKTVPQPPISCTSIKDQKKVVYKISSKKVLQKMELRFGAHQKTRKRKRLLWASGCTQPKTHTCSFRLVHEKDLMKEKLRLQTESKHSDLYVLCSKSSGQIIWTKWQRIDWPTRENGLVDPDDDPEDDQDVAANAAVFRSLAGRLRRSLSLQATVRGSAKRLQSPHSSDSQQQRHGLRELELETHSAARDKHEAASDVHEREYSFALFEIVL